MKTKIFIYYFVFFVITSLTYSQSDYETLQRFKRDYQNIETSIKNASSLDECNLIDENIKKLESDFAPNKEFLDKALYPENYQSSFDKIENSFESRKQDFSQITTLTAKVGSLQSEVVELNQKNEDLINQIAVLQFRTDKNQASIAKLNSLVSQLRTNINKRDLLIRDLVDNILSDFIKQSANLGQKESQSIISKVNKENLFYNIERTIDDNIQFLKVTGLTADDYSKIILQYQGFNKVWNQIGQRLSNVYLTENQKKSEILQIDSLFIGWNTEINSEIWKNIQNEFSNKNIKLAEFHDANSFITGCVSFIDNEIKNLGIKDKSASEKVFHTFMDSVYYKTVANKWIPLLIDNHMLTENQKNVLEAKLDEWQKDFVPSIPFWPFLIGGIILFILIVYIYQKMQKPSHKVKLNYGKQ